jgi:hypothetical protein
MRQRASGQCLLLDILVTQVLLALMPQAISMADFLILHMVE